MCDIMMRISLLVAFALFQINRGVDGYHSGLRKVLHADRNKIMYGHSLQNFSGLTIEKCIQYCLHNCLCLSFQLCDHTRKCQLCSSNKYFRPEALKQSNGCTSFIFKDQDEVGKQQCSKSCTSVINCCMTSSPCLNGGTCLPPLSSRRKRFRCKCPDGYEGERCEVKLCELGYTGKQCEHRIRSSCRGYINGSRIPGNYTVFDHNNKSFEVYCDFDRNSSMTWTLIQSYSLENNILFKNKPLSKDAPQNENHPSWLKYRLSKSRIESIQNDSTKWRVTCQYETDGVNYTDYLRASNAELNILTFITNNDLKCVEVEYINIRGQSCTDCTAGLRQKDGTNSIMLNFNSNRNDVLKCKFSFVEYKKCLNGKGCEHNFGWYRCINNQHRCSSSNNATTQTWFGGEG